MVCWYPPISAARRWRHPKTLKGRIAKALAGRSNSRRAGAWCRAREREVTPARRNDIGMSIDIVTSLDRIRLGHSLDAASSETPPRWNSPAWRRSYPVIRRLPTWLRPQEAAGVVAKHQMIILSVAETPGSNCAG